MLKEINKYCNPQKGFTALESNQVMRKKFKSKDVTNKEMKILLKVRKRLIDQANNEFYKPPAPPGFYPREVEKFLFEPYQSYLDELTWDANYYQKLIRDPFVKVAKRGMYGTSKEKFDDIMRLIRIYTKKFQMMKKIKHLHFTTEQEAYERDMGEFFQIIDSYLISKYTSQMIKGFEVTIKKGKAIVKRPDLNALEAQMDNYAFMKSLLERTIFISVSLQDESLSEEKRNDHIKMREKLRESYKFAQMYEVRRASQNGENFENLADEVHGAHKDAMKFMNLYLKAGDEVFLKPSNVKTDGFEKELIDLRKILRTTDLTTEERKYFLKRKALLEKEVDWEGTMKKLIADFPYERNLYFPKRD